MNQNSPLKTLRHNITFVLINSNVYSKLGHHYSGLDKSFATNSKMRYWKRKWIVLENRAEIAQFKYYHEDIIRKKVDTKMIMDDKI
jgi:hypothetical protein